MAVRNLPILIAVEPLSNVLKTNLTRFPAVWSGLSKYMSASPDDDLETCKGPCGPAVPMPTLPSTINPPVGAAVVSYPAPKLPPPLTLNFDPGAVSPMPTLPELVMYRLFAAAAELTTKAALFPAVNPPAKVEVAVVLSAL